jgi:23S rRNA pseudouridine2605 synthase
VRKVLETLGLKVNRLIRVAFGPFELGELDDGAVEEVPTEALRAALGPELAKQAEADFEAPVIAHDDESRRKRPSPSAREPHERPAPAARKKPRRRDRTGGPRPKYPRQK